MANIVVFGEGMRMTSYLRSNAVVDDVEDVIALLSSKRGELSAAMVEQVRRMHANSDRAKLVVELALGTMRARTMGKYRPGWLFTRRMAEQATHPVIAAYHAGHYRERGCVLDICTGPGIDAAALASVVERVVTIEADEVVCAIATGNLLRSGVKNAEVLWGRWPEVGTVDRWDGVWADPSRRSEGRRVFTADQYEPPLPTIPDAPLVGIKVGPGDQIRTDRFQSEFVGFGTECRERILWGGVESDRPLVTLLSETRPPVSWTPHAESRSSLPRVVQSGAYLIEPHNAIIASGAVSSFFVEKGADVLDLRIGYGILEHMPVFSPWYDIYRIDSIVPGVSVRRMQEEVRRRGWGGGTVIKKRGWDKDPESVRRTLHFENGGPAGVIFVSRIGASHVTIYATCEERRGSQ